MDSLYAALYPSYGRTVKNLFLREDFAIPLMIFALFFTASFRSASTRRTTGCEYSSKSAASDW